MAVCIHVMHRRQTRDMEAQPKASTLAASGAAVLCYCGVDKLTVIRGAVDKGS